MADSLISTVVNNLHTKGGVLGPYFSDPLTGLVVLTDAGGDINTAHTTDGGTSWTLTEVEAGNVRHFAAVFDLDTPGFTSTILHIVWYDLTNDLQYIAVDVSDGTHGAIVDVGLELTIEATDNKNTLAVTQTVSGNLIVTGSTDTEIITYKTSDYFATAATSIANCQETATESDYVRLFPADTGDSNDACALFWDRSADEISIKMYDDSANTWTETSVATSMVDSTTFYNINGTVRFSDNHLIVVAHTDDFSSVDDLAVYDITVDSIASPTITQKTDVYTNKNFSFGGHILINNQNDDLYVAYITRDGTPYNIYYKKSTDGGTTWGSEVKYNETNGPYFAIGGPRSISSSGGRIQFTMNESTNDEVLTNLTNDIEISAAVVGSPFIPQIRFF